MLLSLVILGSQIPFPGLGSPPTASPSEAPPEPDSPSPADLLPSPPVERHLQQHADRIAWLDFTPDERHLISLAADNSIAVWELPSGSLVGWVPALTASLSFGATLSPDSRLLVAGGFNGGVECWTIPEAERAAPPAFLSPARPARGLIRALAFLPDGRLVTGADDGSLECSAAPGSPEKPWKLSLGGPIRSIEALPGGEAAAVAVGEEIRVVDLALREVLTSLKGNLAPIERTAASRDGRWLVSSSPTEAVVWDLDLRSQVLFQPLSRRHLGAVALSPEGGWLAHPWETDRVRLVQLGGAEHERTLEGHTSPVTALAFSPQGRWLVAGAQDGSLRLQPLPVPPGSDPRGAGGKKSGTSPGM